jgi:hypothetical protein
VNIKGCGKRQTLEIEIYAPYINYYHHMRMMNKTISIIASIALSFALFFAYTGSAAVFAQNQSTSTSSSGAGNDTASQNQSGQGGQQSNQTGGGPLGSIGQMLGKLVGGK